MTEQHEIDLHNGQQAYEILKRREDFDTIFAIEESVRNLGWKEAWNNTLATLKASGITNKTFLDFQKRCFMYTQFKNLPQMKVVRKKFRGKTILVVGEHPDNGKRGVFNSIEYNEDDVDYVITIRHKTDGFIKVKPANILALI